MKTLKILTLLCMMLSVITTALNAQPVQKTEETSTGCWGYPCIGEQACGEITHTTFWNKNIWTDSYSGKLTGESGKVYLIKSYYSGKNIFNKGEVHSYQADIMVHADGKLVAIMHGIYHLTINANGEMVSWRDDDWNIECK
jgi:hypothetical protein